MDGDSKCLGESLVDERCLDLESIAILCSFGYSDVEARFLNLVVTHSGYFTRQQFLRFTGKTKGWAVHRFTQKLLTRGHAKVTPLLHKTYLLRLCSRQIYDELERPDLRIRSTCSDEFILARLFSLDFVIAHPTLNYLETSAEKTAFFTEKMGFPMQILPGKVYAGIPSLQRKKRYFTDRFPIYLDSENLSLGALPRPVFVYCDPYAKSLDAFKTHLKRYEDLLYRLPDFRFVYASPYPKKLVRAKAMFDGFMRLQERLDLAELVRYFRVRWLGTSGSTPNLRVKIATESGQATRDFAVSHTHPLTGNGVRNRWEKPG